MSTQTDDWDEFWSLWMEQLFGNDLDEELHTLQKVLDAATTYRENSSERVKIVLLEFGSQRVMNWLIGLDPHNEMKRFEIWNIEPSWSLLNARKAQSQKDVHTLHQRHTIHWAHTGTTTFADTILHKQPSIKADLIFLPAGIFHTLLTDTAIKLFLDQVSKLLELNHGRLLLSFLHEYMPETDDYGFTAFGTVRHGEDIELKELRSTMQRLPSKLVPGRMYIKQPSKLRSDGAEYGEVRSEVFKLECEDGNGRAMSGREVRRDMKVLDGVVLLDQVREAGLRLGKIVDGRVFECWVLEREGVCKSKV